MRSRRAEATNETSALGRIASELELPNPARRFAALDPLRRAGIVVDVGTVERPGGSACGEVRARRGCTRFSAPSAATCRARSLSALADAPRRDRRGRRPHLVPSRPHEAGCCLLLVVVELSSARGCRRGQSTVLFDEEDQESDRRAREESAAVARPAKPKRSLLEVATRARRSDGRSRRNRHRLRRTRRSGASRRAAVRSGRRVGRGRRARASPQNRRKARPLQRTVERDVYRTRRDSRRRRGRRAATTVSGRRTGPNPRTRCVETYDEDVARAPRAATRPRAAATELIHARSQGPQRTGKSTLERLRWERLRGSRGITVDQGNAESDCSLLAELPSDRVGAHSPDFGARRVGNS